MSLNNYFNTPKYKGFDSKFEHAKYVELELLLKSKKIKDFKIQVPLDLIVNGYLVGKYIMDFVVYHSDNTIELLECKGLATDLWKYKYRILKAMYANHPHIRITVEYQKSWSGKVNKEPIPKKLPKNYKSQF
jgi:hypothetical protein